MGHNASLTFNYDGSQLEVNLHSSLNQAQNLVTPYNQKSSSARARRRKRRREARNSQQIEEVNITTDDYQHAMTDRDQAEIIQYEGEDGSLSRKEDLPTSISLNDRNDINLLDLPSTLPTMQAEIDRKIMMETNAVLAQFSGLESNYYKIEDKIHALNSDAAITDENIARLGCRLTNVEHFLRDRGLVLPLLD